MVHGQDIVGQIMDYEEGNLGQEDTLVLFQSLIDSGMAWTLQGSYGRTAKQLIERGLCRLPGTKTPVKPTVD